VASAVASSATVDAPGLPLQPWHTPYFGGATDCHAPTRNGVPAGRRKASVSNWYLNRFLTSWRTAINLRCPKRSKASDGTIGDQRHQAESFSEHNPDRDGSVDAFDMDVNLLGSFNDTGTTQECAMIETLKADFQRLPESQLWIHNGQIANRDIGHWERRAYHGVNRHDHHVHWQSRSSMETVAVSASVVDNVVTAINNPVRLVAYTATAVPPWPVNKEVSFDVSPGSYVTVERAQRRLHERGWRIVIDGKYGPKTRGIVLAFQREKRLSADGKLGPQTWHALWASPITY
jgi:peptidoglycan hydrolase-like protein with peptidoglycan-binding domain